MRRPSLRTTGYFALLAGVALGSVACGGDCPNCPGQLAVVKVSPGSASVLPGRSVQLAALGLDGKNHLLTISNIGWSSLDPSVATVDGTGLVAGLSVGTARIVAVVEGKQDTGTVAVVTTSTFSGQVYPVLATTCATAFCHVSPGPAPNLSSASAAFTSLTSPTGGYLIAGDTTMPGKLMHRIRGDTTAQMPPGNALVNLQPGNYDLITLWIQQGALNN
jgi:Bacterial Ig-like domain (group 2)